jgi:hypothetical protein
MNKDKQNELLLLLGGWFAETDLTSRNVWQRNAIAALIKERMKAIDKWRNKRRKKLEKNYKETIKLNKIKEEALMARAAATKASLEANKAEKKASEMRQTIDANDW